MLISRRRLLQRSSVAAVAMAIPNAVNAGLHLHGAVPLYEGLVASRARMLINNANPDTTNKYLMGTSAHFATENLSAVKIGFANFASYGSGDIGVGAAATITAGIEYPPATFTQVTFSAVPTGTIPNKSVLFSDYIPVSIPSGALFRVWPFWHSTAGTLYNNWQNTFLGEAVELSATPISDRSMGGTITNSGAFSYPPISILGMTTNASVIIIGDSIANGSGDTEDSSSTITGRDGKVGIIARSLGSVPFLNMAANGETTGYPGVNTAARQLMIQKGSHLVGEHGTNDIFGNNTTEANLITALKAEWALARADQKVFQTTILPRTNSSDAWTTLGNQSQISAPNNTTRVAFNTDLRGGVITAPNLKGFFDVASVFESSLNSGNWLVTPTPPYTADGIHPNVAGYALVPGSGVVSPIVWP